MPMVLKMSLAGLMADLRVYAKCMSKGSHDSNVGMKKKKPSIAQASKF